ncbi:MAG: hypothetical protein Q8P67_06130, partial [archaeon]|nr:hypothetical protein [archaeon]
IAHFVALYEQLFTFLMDVLRNLSSDARLCTRWRVCQFVAAMLECAEKHRSAVAVDDRIFEAIRLRLRDKVPLVREAAALAAQRLQTRSDFRLQLTEEMARLLQSDSNTAVRKTALRNILPSKGTILDILSRARDVSPDIRVSAYRVLQEKLPTRYLSKSQRKALAYEGLRDRDPRVRDACAAMIVNNWLHYCERDLLRFMGLFDVVEHEATVEMVLVTLFAKDFLPASTEFWQGPVTAIIGAFRRLQLNQTANRSNLSLSLAEDDVMPPLEQVDEETAALLTPAAALLWRAWIEHSKSIDDEAALDRLVPSAPDLRVLFAVTTDPFVLKQLLTVTHFVFLSTDECGRGELSTIVRSHLENLSENQSAALVPLAMKRLHELHPRASEFIDITQQLIHDLLDTVQEMTPEAELQDEVQSLKSLVAQHQDRLRSSGLEAAEKAELKAAIAELTGKIDETIMFIEAQDDLKAFSYVRSFALLESLLTFCQNRVLHKDCPVLPLFEVIPKEVSTSLSPDVIQAGLRCLCILGLLEQSRAELYFPDIFYHAFQPLPDPPQLDDPSRLDDSSLLLSNDDLLYAAQVQTKIVALQCFFDLVAQYGTTPFLSDAGTAPAGELTPASSKKDLWRELGKLMRDANVELKTVVAEGVAKLLVLQRIEEKSLLINAILLFFHPATVGAYRMRQCLTIFFEAYADRFHSNRPPLAHAYLGACATIIGTEALHGLPLFELTRWVISLTEEKDPQMWDAREHQLGESDRTPHDIIAEGLLSLILNESHSPLHRNMLCRGMRYLRQINRSNSELMKKLEERTKRAIAARPTTNPKNRHPRAALEGFLYILGGAKQNMATSSEPVSSDSEGDS